MEPNKIMTGPAKVQKPSCNFHKQELILTRIILQLYTSKPVKTAKLDCHVSPDKHYTPIICLGK